MLNRKKAAIVRKLDAIQEVERTELDNSMILFLSSMLTGAHDAAQLSALLVSRGGGGIKAVRVLDSRASPAARSAVSTAR
ncbi:hypothetical protein [Singulisphaera sp. PoT]|uniref:hypothetical protein n=1 Tax=Singulisphaera sp. PoT TaxID=3411797 RepID=UPI003BF46336